jgi:PadR family transcriptional regulator PadR
MDTNRDILRGFIKVHILFHASQEPVYGLGLIEELARHGYHLSPGTLYPILHSMEKDSYLSSYEEVVNGKVRRYYRATSLGQETLRDAQAKIKELVTEVLGEESGKDSEGHE